MPFHSEDSALETLFLPFVSGQLAWPDRALFLRARDGAPLRTWQRAGLECEQSFKPHATGLEQAGFVLTNAEDHRRWPLVLLLPPRQRDEARALMARAVAITAPGGRVIASASNNEGARSSETDLQKLVGPVATLTKNKCRVFWSAPLDGPGDAALAAQWRELDAIRPIESGRYMSRPGVFAWDRIDPASALLARHLPPDLQGTAADLGTGFGYLSVELLSRCSGITALDLYEAERRALDLAKINLRTTGSAVPLSYQWHDVTTGLPKAYDAIVSNPPFHTGGREDRPDVGRRFIAAAAESLRPGGRLLMVANRHLPYESMLNAHFGKVRTLAQEHGFKIIEGTRSPASPAAMQGAR